MTGNDLLAIIGTKATAPSLNWVGLRRFFDRRKI